MSIVQYRSVHGIGRTMYRALMVEVTVQGGMMQWLDGDRYCGDRLDRKQSRQCYCGSILAARIDPVWRLRGEDDMGIHNPGNQLLPNCCRFIQFLDGRRIRS